ncbi:hypothetical protein ACJVC5_09415 [Peredibacter sp. HCB2-198]|uniref:hypothetical protein n=1 Tax=Peredibacter sp. HCB2-198 TaxID=3383025 RepID=UPI0038B56156
MKTLSLVLLFATFTTSAFANCRLAILNTYISVPANALAELGYEIISEEELQVGDLTATIEDRTVKGGHSYLRGTLVKKEKFTQVISVVRDLPLVTEKVMSKKIKTKTVGQFLSVQYNGQAVEGYDFRILNTRIENLPTCEAVQAKLNK